MKVLIFTSQFCHGGAERLGADLAVDLNRHGVYADVMSMYSSDLGASIESRRELLSKGVPVVHYLGLRPNPSPYQLLKGIIRLNRIIRKFNYSIVETSSLTPTVIASWSCLGTRVCQIVGIHHSFSKDVRKLFRHRVFLASVRLRASTGIYAVSNFVKDSWDSELKLEGRPIRVIYNSITLEAPDDRVAVRGLRRDFGFLGVERIIVCVGRLAGYKRQDLVVEALAPICVREKIGVAFIGDSDAWVKGTGDMLEKIRKDIGEYSLNDNIKFLGRRSDVQAIMNEADLLVHATNKEAFGLVLAEALALGLPVVSTNVEGIPEVLRGTDSIMVPPNDPRALRNAILAVLSRSPTVAASAREKGKSRSLIFRQQDRTAKMVALFEEALEAHFGKNLC